MACPSGCLNGGGQIKPEQMQTTEKKLDAAKVLEGVESNFDLKDNRYLAQENYDKLLEQMAEEYRAGWFNCKFYPIPPDDQ